MSMEEVGIYLPNPVFSDGMFYVPAVVLLE